MKANAATSDSPSALLKGQGNSSKRICIQALLSANCPPWFTIIKSLGRLRLGQHVGLYVHAWIGWFQAGQDRMRNRYDSMSLQAGQEKLLT